MSLSFLEKKNEKFSSRYEFDVVFTSFKNRWIYVIDPGADLRFFKEKGRIFRKLRQKKRV